MSGARLTAFVEALCLAMSRGEELLEFEGVWGTVEHRRGLALQWIDAERESSRGYELEPP